MVFRMEKLYVATCVFVLLPMLSLALRGDECQVCIKVLERFKAGLSDKESKDMVEIEKKFRTFCETTVGKENRFCYYLGGLENSATGIIKEMAKPLSWGAPMEVVCEKLKKVDGQICELIYDKEINWKEVNLKKLKVRDLRKILSEWGEGCEGCIEKTDFIKRIEDLKPKYVREEL